MRKFSFLLALLFFASMAQAQVKIDDRDVILDNGQTLEQAIAAGTLGGDDVVVDVNPTAVGTHSAGIQEAIDACPATGCIVQFRKNTTYTLPQYSTWTGGDATCMAETNGKDNIWFRGYGPGSSHIQYDNAVITGLTKNVLLCAEPGTANFAFSDLSVTSTSACLTNCVPASSDYNYQIRLYGNVENAWIERNVFSLAQAVNQDPNVPYTFAIEMNGYPDTHTENVPKNVNINRNVFHGTHSGIIHAIGVNGLVVNGNYFDFPNVLQDPNAGNKASMRALGFTTSEGVIFTNNVVDMSINGITNPYYAGGVEIIPGQDFPTPATRKIGKGLIIKGNVFKGLRSSYQAGVWISGHNYALVADNEFISGQCNADSKYSCSSAYDCARIGGSEASWTCDSSAAKGIWFSTGGLAASMDANQGNTISNNIFRGFQDTGATCPLSFDAPGADANSNLYNVFANNTLILSDATQDGICGDAGRIAGNQISNNYVVGAAITKPVQVIDRDMSEFILNGDGEGDVMTPVYSKSIPANMLGSTGAIRLTLSGYHQRPVIGGTGAILKIEFGGTTIYQSLVMASVPMPDTSLMPIEMTFILANQGATNAQRLVGSFIASYPQAQTNGTGALTLGTNLLWTGSLRGTSAEDTTAAKNLIVSFRLGGTRSDNIIVVDNVLLELL